MATVTIKNDGGSVAYFVDGARVTRAEALAAADPAKVAESFNERALLDKAAAAIAANAEYLAAPVAGTTAARLAALEAEAKRAARQRTALLRLASRALSDTSGT